MSAKGSEIRTAYNRGTQHSLLKLIEGKDIDTDNGTISTADLLFIFGGAFTGLQKDDTKIHFLCDPIGFMRDEEDLIVEEDSVITTEDFVRYGMEAELMGRIGQQIPLQELTAENLKKILLDSRLSLYRQYQKFFLQHEVQLHFTDARLDELVDQALMLGTGARALNALVEEAVEPLLLHLAEGRLQRKDRELVDYAV